MDTTIQGPVSGIPGHAEPAPQGTPDPTPAPTSGHAADPTPTGHADTSAPDTASFFDRKEFDAHLATLRGNEATKALADQTEALAKSLLGSWTRKNQEASELLKTNAQKISAYDAFSADPVTNLQKMATQYGFRLSRADAAAAVNAAATGSDEPWTPNSWEEVIQRTRTEAETALMEKLKPLLGNVQSLQAKAIETQLDSIDPLWKRNESRMVELMTKHPSLVNDLPTLYELAMPAEEREAAATKRALDKLRVQQANAQVEAGTTTRKSTPAPKKVTSFQEAVDAAREQGRKDGWYRG